MKRFIIISLLAAIAARGMACIWMATDNYYLFCFDQQEDFSFRADEITRENWKAYLGMSSDDYFYFDADEIISKAKSKNDELMVSYVENLQKYLDCARDVDEETWNYPSKEELADRALQLNSVRTYALSKVKSRLRSQHALLYMRCNMLLGRHQENVDFWEQTAKDFIETVYKDMMENIYAGALLKCGRDHEAGQIFARQGDYSSLMTQYYTKRSCQAIRQEYQRDPNSAVLPFLLQDFVNNAQEACDGSYDGKLFIRDIQQAEARQMMALCQQAATEGKSRQPILWKSAKAWLEYMFGDKQQALSDIKETATLDGTDGMKNVARVLRLYITGAMTPVNIAWENYVADELRWLQSMKDSDDYYGRAFERITHQMACDKLQKAGRQTSANKMKALTDASAYELYLDTASVDDALAALNYFKGPMRSPIDKFLKENDEELNPMAVNDLIATKYLRLSQWQQAIEWLLKVPTSYYADKGYAPYAALRRWSVEPWVKRQWLREDQTWGEGRAVLKQNPKLVFAREMQQMEAESHVLSGQALCQRYYDLAVRYAQAHITGDCWFLLNDTKGVYDEDDRSDFAQKAVDLLRKAGRTTNRQLKEKVLFARVYYYLNPDCWYEAHWDSNISDYVRTPNLSSMQYNAFAALADFEKSNPDGTPVYISRCDEYIQFRKFYK